MADIQITQLPANATPAGTLVIETQVDALNGTSEKVTLDDVVAIVPLDDYLPLAGGTMDALAQLFFDTGGQILHTNGDFMFTNLGFTGSVIVDATTGKLSLQSAPGQTMAIDSTSGAFMNGPLDMSTLNKIINLADPTLPQDAATRQYVLDNAGGAGDGDVVGPAGAVDSNFASFDTATGKLIKDSGSAPADFATAAQGTTADTALQPGDVDNVSELINDSGYITAVVEDTAPALGGNLNLNDNALVATMTASATFAAEEFGILNTATNPGPVLSNASTEAGATGSVVMALEAITSGNPGLFAIYGLVDIAALPASGQYYLSTTAGQITTTPPVGSGQVVRLVGTGNVAGQLAFTPDMTTIVLA